MIRNNNHKNVSCLLVSLVCLGMMACNGNKTAAGSGIDSDSIATDSGIVTESEVGQIEVEKYDFAKSGKFADVKVEVYAPMGTDAVSCQIRDVLMGLVDADMAIDAEGSRTIQKYAGDKADVRKCIAHYGLPLYKQLSIEARQQYEDMQASSGEDDSDGAIDPVEPQMYDHSLTISKDSYETSSIVVFNEEYSVYYGGAHPSSGACSVTFDKKTGKELKKFFVPGAASKMQKLIRKGLVGYFNDFGESVSMANLNECLMIEGKIIPLPSYNPCPSKEGLIFTYQQYEIASYACGMPQFVISYSDVEPFLTDEAKALLLLK